MSRYSAYSKKSSRRTADGPVSMHARRWVRVLKAATMAPRSPALARPPLRALPGGISSTDPTPVLDDDTIIEAVQRHDDRVASALYDRLVGTVDRTLYQILGRRGADHDDLVQ